MEIIQLEEKDYQRWDTFCLESKDTWFWHTTSWLKYILKLRDKSVSRSFFIEIDNRIVAICLLVLQDKKFWSNNKFCLLPAFAELTIKEKGKIEKVVYREIERLAVENKVDNIYMRYIPLVDSFVDSKHPPFNILLKYGYVADSWSTQIIDLSKDLEEIKREVRHGHIADIKSASKVLKRIVFDKDNITKQDFEMYREMHHRDAKRITRPIDTFNLMYDFIKKGDAFLIGAKYGEEFVGFSYFFIYKKKVYYGSSATNGLRDIGVGHFLLWEGIRYMKEKEMSYFEIGHQYYDNHQIIDPSKKEIEIGKFKQGFGGNVVPIYAGRKG